MARLRSLPSTMLSARQKFTMPSICSATFGLCRSMLKGPRIWPNTFSTPSTTAWYSAGTSDFPVTGATLGMTFVLSLSWWWSPSGDGAGGPQRADLLGGVADGGQDLVGVLTDPRRGALDGRS